MFSPEIRRLGRLPFEQALDVQSRVVAEVESGNSAGAILLFESEPVVTLGRRQHAAHARFLRQVSVPVVDVDRGGLETYHGPGQWVAFWVGRLQDSVGPGAGVGCFVQILLESTKSFCLGLTQDAGALELREGAELGLWGENNNKIASVGVRNSRGILSHGISLNVLSDARSFHGIEPCGLSEARPGFLADYSDLSPEELWSEVERGWPEALVAGLNNLQKQPCASLANS